MQTSRPEFSARMLHPRYWLLWLALGLCALLARLPYAWQLALGRGVGLLLNRFAKQRRRIASINLALCLPELTDAEREALLKANMLAMGMGLMEQNMGWFMPRARLRALIQVQGLEHLAALAEQGALVVTRHTSSVQLAVVAATMFQPFAGMYRRHKNIVMDYVQRKCRERMDTRCEAFERKEVRTMLRCLRQGTKVIYAPDQDYGIKQGVWASFFGVTAATVTATSRFAKMGKAKVLMMDFVRLPGAEGYRLSFSPALENFPSDDELADVQQINDHLEAQIRQAPEQYFWVHRRFKNRPAGEAKVY
jgi:Kdo2-lipid IVA lauroyltransferase/acyltransferase